MWWIFNLLRSIVSLGESHCWTPVPTHSQKVWIMHFFCLQEIDTNPCPSERVWILQFYFSKNWPHLLFWGSPVGCWCYQMIYPTSYDPPHIPNLGSQVVEKLIGLFWCGSPVTNWLILLVMSDHEISWRYLCWIGNWEGDGCHQAPALWKRLDSLRDSQEHIWTIIMSSFN